MLAAAFGSTSGLPYEERVPDPQLYEHGRCPTWAEVLRSARARRCADAKSRRAETTEPNPMTLGSIAEGMTG
jgi:hypothetical protein